MTTGTSLQDHSKNAKQLMDKAVDAVKREFSTVRTGRATTALLDLVKVEAYGSEMPLNQVGTVAAPEPKLLTVRSEEHTSELQSQSNLVCRLLLEKKKKK